MRLSFRSASIAAFSLIALSFRAAAPAAAAPTLVRTMSNKMTLIVRENRTRPLVSVQVWIKGGTRDETLQDRGVASVVARTAMQGTKTRTVDAIQTELGLVGASFGNEVGYGYSMFQVTVPARSLSTGLDVISDIVLHPRMTQNDLDAGIASVRQESRAVLAAPERLSINPARQALHPGNPLSTPLAVPELEIAAITPTIAQRFYNSHYVAENMIVVIAGDVDPEDAARKVEIAFQDAPKGKAPVGPKFTEKARTSPAIQFAPSPDGVAGAALTVAFPAPAWGTADALALDVLLAVLVDSPTSRTQKHIVANNTDYSLAAAQRSFESDGGTVALSVRMDPAHTKDAETALLTLIEQARSLPITKDEFDQAIQSVLARDLYPESELWGIGHATAIAYLQGRPGADEVYLDRLKAIQPSDLIAAANTYLDIKKAAIVEMMPQAIADSLGIRSGLEKRVRDTIAMNAAAYHQGPNVAQSTDADRRQRIDGPLAKIPTTPLDAGRGRVERSALGGGLRVLASEDRSAPIVTVGVYLAGGVRYENDKNNGITSLVREALLSSADHAANGTPYRQSLPIIGRLLPYQDRDMWGVSVSVPKDSWRDALTRLGTMFAHPDLDTVSVDATRLLVLTELDKWLDDDDAQRQRLIFAAKYQVSGYRLPGLGNRKNLVSIPQRDVEAWYKKFVVRGNLVVTVFGDVPTSDVAPAVDQAFHDVSSDPFQPGTIPQEGEFANFREKWELGEGPLSTVTLAFEGPPAKSPDVPALYVVNSLLSGPQGWFKQYLESNAYIHSANSVVSNAQDECPIIASVNIEGPYQEEGSVKLLFRQFKKVAFLPMTTGANADTLRFAKTHAVSSYLTTLSSNSTRSFQWARAEIFGLGSDYPIVFPARMDAVTSADVERIGMRYFEKDQMNKQPYAVAETRPGGW
jgi:zinc protease